MSSTTQSHILAYPFPTSGHVIPLLDFVKNLVSRGVYVTVLVTPSNLPLLQPLLPLHAPFLQHLILPPPQFPDPKLNRLVSVVIRMRQLHHPIVLQWAQSHPIPPLAIISDFFLGWTHQLASDLHIPHLVFSPSGASGILLLFSLWRDLPENKNPDDANSVISFPNIPNSPVYPWWQILHHYRNHKKGDVEWEFHRENTLFSLASWGFVFNSFTELERVYLDHVKKELGHDRVWAVGPVLPHNDDGSADRGGSSSVPSDEVLTWLDSKPERSVVYVCFGSRTVLTGEQMEVLTGALEISGVHFILSLRSPDERHVGQDHGQIPEGFEDRVGVTGRGLFIKGWAPQLAILGHGAVGAFLTHCGWNSVLEALVAGVLMLTWPMGADQFTNAKLLVDQLGAAVGAAEGTENVPEARELGRRIKSSLDLERPERVRAEQLREAALKAISEGGSSYKQLDDLVSRFRGLKLARPTSAEYL